MVVRSSTYAVTDDHWGPAPRSEPGVPARAAPIRGAHPTTPQKPCAPRKETLYGLANGICQARVRRVPERDADATGEISEDNLLGLGAHEVKVMQIQPVPLEGIQACRAQRARRRVSDDHSFRTREAVAGSVSILRISAL
jgi:hypothetical protein